MRNRLFFVAALGLAANPPGSEAVPEESSADSALTLLQQAIDNQYRGAYTASVMFIRESFLRGRDSLRGRLSFNDQTGDRQMRLQGRDEAFEWWSRNFGQEQWWMDGTSERQHRVPFRSLKKPAFASLLAYEDLMKFPADYLLEFESWERMPGTDSSFELRLRLKSSSQSRYGALEVSLGRKPVLLRRLVFYAPGGRRLKSLEITGYRQAEGMYLPTVFRVFNADSLSSLLLSLSDSKIDPADGRDNTAVRDGAAHGSRNFFQRILKPSDPGNEKASEEGGVGDTASN